MSGRLTPVVLDTNIASQRYKKRVQVDLTRLVNTTSVISFVTYAEMCKWALVRDWAPHNLAQLTAWLDRTPVIDSGKAVSTMWGQLAAAGARRSWPRGHGRDGLVRARHALAIPARDGKDPPERR